MDFFNSAVDVLQTLVIALGAGLGIWGGINLMEGYGNDNPGAKSQGMKQLMAGGGVQKIYMMFLREPSQRDRSGSDLFHLRDGFEIEVDFDGNVSCLIAVDVLMDNDFFNQAV